LNNIIVGTSQWVPCVPCCHLIWMCKITLAISQLNNKSGSMKMKNNV
jgi:hypothetical protein